MRRPFAIIGFTYIVSLLIASAAGLGISAAAAVLSIVCAAVVFFGMSFLKYRKAVTAVFCTAAAAFGIFCLFECVNYNPSLSLAGKEAQIEGTVCEDPSLSYGRYVYTVKAEKIAVGGKLTNIKTKIRISSFSKLSAEPFDKISVKVKLNVPQEVNAYGYNSRSYYKSKGVYLMASINGDEAAVSKTTKKPFYYYAIKLRHYISTAIDKYVWGDEGALASGILIGDVKNLPDEVKSNFTNTGISHILAVSGTQTSLIMQYLLLLLCFLKVPKRISAVITQTAIIIFMAVTGFSPSVMRAGIMSLVFLAAIIIKRDADVINSLGFSALVLCLFNPYAATDVGLLLSLAATLGMVIVSPKLNAFSKRICEKLPLKLNKSLRPILTLLSETIGASLLTFPIIVISFGRISLVSLLSNIVEVPLALAVTLLTAVLAIMSPAFFLEFLIKPIALIIRLLCALMMWFAKALASLPFSSVSASYGYLEIVTVFFAVLFVLYFIFRKKGGSAPICLCCGCIVLTVGMFSFAVASHGVMTVSVLDDSGSCVVTSCGHAVLIDIPKSSKYPALAENYLKVRNIRSIDAVILTKTTDKKLENLANLEKDLPVGIVYTPKTGKADMDTGNKNIKKISEASEIRAPYGVKITMMPNSKNDEMIALVACKNAHAVVTGESSGGDYTQYNPQALKANLLVFSGNPSDNILKEISPVYASGTNGSNAQTIAQLITLGSSVNTSSRSYLTRSGEGFMVSDSIS